MAKHLAKQPKKAVKAAPKTAEKQEFVLRRGDGNKVLTGFDPETDRLRFEFGSYQDTMTDKPIADGVSFQNLDRTANWSVRAVDGDTLITVNADTVRLVGVTPDQLRGWNFQGG